MNGTNGKSVGRRDIDVSFEGKEKKNWFICVYYKINMYLCKMKIDTYEA